MNDTQKKNTFWTKFVIDNNDIKSKVLSRSLLWMALGLSMIVLVAFLSSNFPTFSSAIESISLGGNWLFAWLTQAIVLMLLYWSVSNQKIHIAFPIIIYLAFCFYEGLFITSILIFSGSLNVIKDLLIYMLIPAAIFGIMGILAYFNLINFTKLIPFVSFASIGLLIISLTLFFVNNDMLQNAYIILATLVLSVLIGIQMQLILRSDDNIVANDKKTLLRLTFIYGIQLFNIFTTLLRMIIIFMRNY